MNGLQLRPYTYCDRSFGKVISVWRASCSRERRGDTRTGSCTRCRRTKSAASRTVRLGTPRSETGGRVCSDSMSACMTNPCRSAEKSTPSSQSQPLSTPGSLFDKTDVKTRQPRIADFAPGHAHSRSRKTTATALTGTVRSLLTM